jgi:hypothetical protein
MTLVLDSCHAVFGLSFPEGICFSGRYTCVEGL